ncbi:MAG: DUF362 domain-containing protein [Spirochaetes bacterium]|nr:DUF362 domain-containing protein [Spirochaetota bacterium]
MKVVFYNIEEYDSDIISTKIKEGLDFLGGFKNYFSNGDKVLLKPNLLASDSPSTGVITHPVFFEGVVKFFIEEIKKNQLNIELSCGDSPAIASPLKVSKDSGIYEVCKKYNVPFIEFKNKYVIKGSNKNVIKIFEVAEEIKDKNKIVSLPKLKNHSLTVFTGGIKNLFGVIPGKIKAYYHTRFPDSILFSKMIVDLADSLNTSICIMDGIIAHEGHGPRGGNPIKLGYLILGENPFVVDLLATTLVGYIPEKIPFLKYFSEKHNVSLNIFDTKAYQIYGDKLNFRKEFNKIHLYRENVIPSKFRRGFFYNNIVSSKPYFIRKNCILCMECYNICPTNPKSIIKEKLKKIENKIILRYNYNTCIRCFCCQEICPQKAIEIKHSFVSKLLKNL